MKIRMLESERLGEKLAVINSVKYLSRILSSGYWQGILVKLYLLIQPRLLHDLSFILISQRTQTRLNFSCSVSSNLYK